MIIIINITLIIKSEINDKEIPDFFGYTPFIIISGSMEPNIPVNDMIITKRINSDNIKVTEPVDYYIAKAIIEFNETKNILGE